MIAVDVCNLPATGGSTFVVIAGLFLLVAGVIVARWVRTSAGRLSVVVAPLVLLGGLVLAPQVADPCAPATTTVPSATTTVPSATTTVPSATTTVPSATTTVAPTTTTLAPIVYQVGAAGPGGGIIFYKDMNRPAGSQYFEVACAGWSDEICGGNDVTDPTAAWGCSGAPITGAGGTAIGTGEQNTTDITAPVGGCSTAGIAARLANEITLGGQDDWFLPSQDELNALCKWAFGDVVNTVCNNNGSGGLTLLGVGGFSTDRYWSSSQYGSNGWYQRFSTGFQGYSNPLNSHYVRPVRAF